MPLDTLTLALEGDIPLGKFADAMGRFRDLILALSGEEGAADVDWVIEDLSRGSALAVVRGVGPIEPIERVVRAFGEVGVAMQEERPVGRAAQVNRAAGRLRKIAGGRVAAVRLETPEREAIIRAPAAGLGEETLTVAGAVPQHPPLPAPTFARASASFGAVEGRVQTLSSRGGLRFTLYDTLNDKAVSCYLAEGSESIMRDAWGQLATVEGIVSRDPASGRPLAIRQVRRVTLKQADPRAYRDARGASRALTDLSPEAAIRRLRDG